MRNNAEAGRRYGAVALLASLLQWPGLARAGQDPLAAGPIAVGSKVRLQAPATVQGPIDGTVMQMDAESLLISTKDNRPLRVSWQTITQAEVSTGRRGNARKGMLIGAPVGLLIGAILPLDSFCTPAELEVNDSSCEISRGGMIAFGIAAYAGAGALIGHFIKSDRWSPVPPERLRVSLAPAPGRGARFALSVSW